MAEKKKQHFVPKLLLKNFTFNERFINQYNLRSHSARKNIPYEDQCQKKYLYGQDLVIENALGELEDAAGPAISRILSTKTVPLKDGNKDFLLLTEFMIFQNSRTLSAKNAYERLADSYFENIVKEQLRATDLDKDLIEQVKMKLINPLGDTLKNSARLIPVLCDLDFILICNETPVEFIITDNPSVLMNSYMDNATDSTGIAWKGLQIIMPISPEYILGMVDPQAYVIPKNRIVTIAKQTESIALNACIAANADQSVYYRSISDQDIEVIANLSNSLITPVPEEFAVTQSLNTKSIEFTKTPARIPNGFKFLKEIESGKSGVLEVRSQWLLDKVELFNAKVDANEYKQSEFLKFLNDSKVDKSPSE